MRADRTRLRAALGVAALALGAPIGTAFYAIGDFAAIALATLHDASPYMGPAYWIPAVWVPALLVTHYVTFVVLMRRAFRGR